MKLYTEEEIKRTFGFVLSDMDLIGYINTMTPIELPSDEEIEKKFEPKSTMYELGFRDGAKWVIDKIKNK